VYMRFMDCLYCVAVCHNIATVRSLSFRYRFAEIRYYRAEEIRKGRTVPTRVETVVLFLPDVWSCSPTRLEWQATLSRFHSQLETKLSALADEDDAVHAELKALHALLLCCTKLQCCCFHPVNKLHVC